MSPRPTVGGFFGETHGAACRMSDWQIITHGGAGSDPEHTGPTDEGAGVALDALQDGAEPLRAACQAVAHLEADGGFNAGVGSNVRADGRTVEMDAACSDSEGRFGAVACIERVRHPVLAAEHVTETDHLILAGEGALRFARSKGVAEAEPSEFGGEAGHGSGLDTVGCVLGDGEAFAAALSSGGTREAMVGRIGDVPLPGCGLRAGPEGAIAATGNGEAIARERTADRAYEMLSDGLEPTEVVDRVLERFDEASAGLIVVGAEAGAGGSNRGMAYSQVPGGT